MNAVIGGGRRAREVRANLATGLLEVLKDYRESAAGPHPGAELHGSAALIKDAVAARATDIHIEPREHDARVRFRVDGAVVDVAELAPGECRWLVNQLKALAGVDPVARFTPKDSHARTTVQGRAVDLRFALAPCVRGEALAIRLLENSRLERWLDDLGLTEPNLERLQTWLEDVSGMFVAAGPTGSGKTTTIYALLHELRFSDRVVASIEDPIEYEIPGITQMQLDEKRHLTFGEGVKAMLRLDPDYLMIGEVRDAPSAHAALDAAMTGRALLTTVHARDAVGVVSAMRNWGMADHEIAESLAVVVAQRLVRRFCPDCPRLGAISQKDSSWVRAMGFATPTRVWSPVGCKRCNGLGFLGRTGIFELWRLEEEDYRLILAHTDERLLRQKLCARGQDRLVSDGLAKVARGVTSIAELRRAMGGAIPSVMNQSGEPCAGTQSWQSPDHPTKICAELLN